MSTSVQSLESVAQKMVEICVDQEKAPNKVAVHVVVQNKEAMDIFLLGQGFQDCCSVFILQTIIGLLCVISVLVVNDLLIGDLNNCIVDLFDNLLGLGL